MKLLHRLRVGLTTGIRENSDRVASFAPPKTFRIRSLGSCKQVFTRPHRLTGGVTGPLSSVHPQRELVRGWHNPPQGSSISDLS